MENYQRLIQTVQQTGLPSDDRTGTGTKRRFAINRDLRFDLSERFPVPTTKAFARNACFGELLWFATGGTYIKELKQFTHGDAESSKGTIWCANYAKQGTELGYSGGFCGEVYGFNWRSFGGKVDQLQNLVNNIKNDPTSRRLVVYTVNPAPNFAPILPPCHDRFQCFVENGKLSLDFTMR